MDFRWFFKTIFKIWRTVVFVQGGLSYHYCLAPSASYRGLSGEADIATSAYADRKPSLHALYAVVSEKPATDEKRVQLQTVPQLLGGVAPPSEEEVPLPPCRPFAILLRLRVTQIVAGIVIVLLGVVACLEPTTRPTLGLGIPAGFLTVLSAISHIQASRREYTIGLVSVHTTTLTTWGTFLRPLNALRPFLPTLACVLACLLLLALAAMSLGSTNHNRITLGCLQIVTTAVVLGTESVVWFFRWHWTTKPQ